MTQAAHTPGPWNANHYSSVVGLPVSAQPNPKENTIIICGVRGDRAVAEANARLIAAAPDMLALLKDMAKQNEYDSILHDDAATLLNHYEEEITVAIAKAVGRSA